MKPSEEITPTKSSKTDKHLSDKLWFKAAGAAIFALQIQGLAELAKGKIFTFQNSIEFFLLIWGTINFALLLILGGKWVKKTYANIGISRIVLWALLTVCAIFCALTSCYQFIHLAERWQPLIALLGLLAIAIHICIIFIDCARSSTKE